jgi:hypothetical protein
MVMMQSMVLRRKRQRALWVIERLHWEVFMLLAWCRLSGTSDGLTSFSRVSAMCLFHNIMPARDMSLENDDKRIPLTIRVLIG